jgi:hypothetical protein
VITLATAASDEYRLLQDISGPNKAEYCERHGLRYAAHRHAVPFNAISWDRVAIWSRELSESDWLMWMGCDTLVTNQTVDVRDLLTDDADFIFAADGNGLQCDVFLMRNCEATRDYLKRVGLHKIKGTSNEQDALSIELSGAANYADFCNRMVRLYQGGKPMTEETIQILQRELNKAAVRVKIIPQRKLNAYPGAHYGGTGQEDWSWQPGDFILHMPGKGLAERVYSFPRFQIVR